MQDVSRLLRIRFDVEARELGVTRQQWRTLFMLSFKEGQTQAELADRLDVERITCCRMVDRLSELGLVERHADPRDRRVWRLHLTPAALDLIAKLTVIGNRMEEEALSLLTADEAQRFRATLETLREGLRPTLAAKAA